MSESITIFTNERKIKICRDVIYIMSLYIQKGFLSKESGGIVIGKENKSNKNLIINHITVPMDKDKGTYNRFFRKDKRHIKIFKDLYKESNETLRYIGEWHTHPEAIPNFSIVDFNNWKKICKDSNYDSYYHIIIGYKAIRVWIMNNNKFHVKLITTVFWKDVQLD